MWTVIVFLLFTVTASAQLLRIPSMDQRELYQSFDFLPESKYTIVGIKPYPCEKIMAIKKEEEQCREILFKSYLQLDIISTSDSFVYSFIPEKEGFRLEKGLNLSMSLGGTFSPSKNYSLNYQLRLRDSEKNQDLSLHRLSLNLRLRNTLASIGKDSIKVGPSRYGNLMSATHPPFYQIRVQNYYPYEKWGLWQYVFLYGKLVEERQDHSDPDLIFFRLDYKPAKFLEVGANRAILFGGSGRPSYKLYEYPRVFIGREETLSGGKYDNDSYLGYDLKLDLPVRWFDSFQLYYENNATDIESPLKKGDPKKLHFPLILVKFHDDAKTYGVRTKKGNFGLNLEYTLTSKTMYSHHNYPVEGFSYKGFPLGYPYGRSVEHAFLLFGYEERNLSWNFEVGHIRQPVKLSGGIRPNIYMKDVYLRFDGRLKKGPVWISPYLRLDWVDNPNLSVNPVQFAIKDTSKTYFSGGISLLAEF